METSGYIWPNFELIQALMHVLITWKYEKNPIKNSGKCDNSVFPIISLWDFFDVFFIFAGNFGLVWFDA